MTPPAPDPLPPLPEAFLARMQRLLGEEARALTAALDEAPVMGLRLNALKGDPDALRRLLPWDMEPVPWCSHGYALAREPGRPPPGTSPLHAAGAFYLQDPSAMAPAAVLAPHPGERVCDLAAAPGGKTTHLAAAMRGRGVLVANDADPRRARALLSNVERWGAANVILTQSAPARLARTLEGWFDRVLLDAPCSGEGMFRKSAEARRQWSPELVGRCSATQASLLDAAARLLRPGGALVYSTCTFEPDENDRLVSTFLERHPGFTAEPVGLPGVGPLPGSVGGHLWPHRELGDGQYMALLRRSSGAPTRAVGSDGGTRSGEDAGGRASGSSGYARAVPAPARARSAWRAFAEATLGEVAFAGASLLLHGDRLLAAPAGLPPAHGIHLLRVGVLLGRWHATSERFEPAHALAMAAPAGGSMLTLAEGDPRLAAYLHGEPFDAPAADGWLRVAVHDLPLGWARASGGTVRSLLPRGLRRVA